MNGLEAKEAINRILELGAHNAKPQSAQDDGDPFVIVPSGNEVKSLAHLVAPKRIKQNVTLLESGSFCEYVNLFKDNYTRIFADVTEKSAKFVAVIDYHDDDEHSPRYCHHIATFETVQTPEYKTWMEADRKPKDQVGFATWLEDNIQLLRDPKGADLLELVQTLHGKNEVRFTSAVRLQSGANALNYDEDVVLKGQVNTKSGEVKLPPTIMAGIAPFQGAPPYEVHARLKYRIESRKLSLWFETIAPHTIIRDSILLIVKDISEKTEIIPLIGRI